MIRSHIVKVLKMSKLSLTKFNPGSLNELVSIAFPLVLSSLSTHLMLFVDRLLLARYDVLTMTAVVTVSFICSVFQFTGITFTATAEVFVGQFNGAKQYQKLATPVWQMISFSAISCLIYWPVAIWGPTYLITAKVYDLGAPYFRWIMSFAFVTPLIGALAAFFIGRGRGIVVTVSSFIGNAVNAILAYLFIFGKGPFPEMGAEGAAIATVIASSLQALILFSIFLNRKNNQLYKTRRFKFDKSIFQQCLKIASPSAFTRFIEFTGWAFLMTYLATLGPDYMAVNSITITTFILFIFVTEGISKAVGTLSANFIGSHKNTYIGDTFFSAVKLQVYLGLIVAVPLLLFGEQTASLLVDTKSISPFVLSEVVHSLKGIWVLFFLDGIAWSLAGILTAGGDTRFIMLVKSTNVWVFQIPPTILLLGYLHFTPSAAFTYVFPFYGAVNLFIFYWRYKSDKWIKLQVA